MVKLNPFPKEQKMFSVCTPVYKNAYKTLEKFFKHLDEQDYTTFEVLVVFDGKNKRGEKELETVKKKFPHIEVRSEVISHGGAPKARNHAASMSKGDYLTFLDPDVYLYPGTLRKWANALDENPDKDVVWGLYDVLINGEAREIGGSIPMDAKGNPDYYAFRTSNFASGANPMRKEAFIGWDETCKSLQDWDMWMRMLAKDNFKGDKFLYLNTYCKLLGKWHRFI